MNKWDARDKKLKKRKHGMRVDGKSAHLLQQQIIKRAKESGNG